MKLILSVLIIPAALLTACGSSPSEQAGSVDNSGTATVPAAGMVEPVGWREIAMISGNSGRVYGRGEITIGTVGHFSITRNDCYHEAYGAIDLKPWNQLADGLNKIMAMEMLPDEQCFARPAKARDYKLDFQADIVTNTGKISLFDVRGSYENTKICTRVPDLEVARAVLDVLDQTLPLAYAEDCGS